MGKENSTRSKSLRPQGQRNRIVMQIGMHGIFGRGACLYYFIGCASCTPANTCANSYRKAPKARSRKSGTRRSASLSSSPASCRSSTPHADYVTLRRYLTEYGFLDRQPDRSANWVKK
ncbi:DUF2087 domain-containing protein [Paenibacillus thiaminolyticus]|uniref:DUF2087 domain-containing protein n=1 Tax=Paenibacillus thiaminolyticus TaxID=49283 RepID=UPI0035A6E8E4